MASWSSSTKYSEKDVMTMQQEAIRRAREMQARAMQAVEHANSAQAITASKPGYAGGNTEQNSRQFQMPNNSQPQNSFTEQKSQPQHSNNHNLHSGYHQMNGPPFNFGNMFGDGKSLSSMLGSFIGSATEKTKIGEVLKALDLDTEKLIIIGLMIILYNEGADALLLIALAYLLI